MLGCFSFERVLYILLVLSSFPSIAKDVTWLTFSFPPYYIIEGPDKGKGRDELIIELLNQQLPDYRFKKVVMPSSRVIEELSKSSNRYCILSIYKTPTRQDKVVFTNNFSTLGLAPAIIMTKDINIGLPVENTQAKVISLNYLLQQKKYRLGVPAGLVRTPSR